MNDVIHAQPPSEITPAPAPHQPLALSAKDVVTHVKLVQEVMQAVMKEGVHFGVIPGTKKRSLWKPGAELLGLTFRIAPTYAIEDLSTEDSIRYRVFCRGTHQISGVMLGDGAGECSSLEEKYKWRKAVNKAEFDATPENRRRIKYARGSTGDYTINQVRTEPADLANTILKMACKRAQVAMAINVTAASDIFSQDLEDLSEELRSQIADEDVAQAPVTPPRAKSEATATAAAAPAPAKAAAEDAVVVAEKPAVGEPRNETPIGESPLRLLRAKLKQASISEQAFCTRFTIKTLEELKMFQLNQALAWVQESHAQ